MRPALDQERMFPTGSVIATIVLLNVAAMEATPCGTFFRSLRFVPARRAPAFGALAVAIFLPSSQLSAPGSQARHPQVSESCELRAASLFLGCFLLTRNGSLAGALARARVGVRALAAHRQAAAVAHAAVAVDLHQPLDVERSEE